MLDELRLGLFKDAEEAQVVVMFVDSGDPSKLIACKGSSWMHEYAQGWVDDMADAEFGG